MSSFQRFDTDAAIPLSERDLKRRWAVFHKAIHDMSGKRWQRVLGQMLGVDTVRYKVARFFGRPLLQTVRKLRGSDYVSKEVSALPVLSTIFPHNFKPSLIPPLPDLSEFETQLRTVTVVTLNEHGDSATSTIQSLNQMIVDTEATWIFVVDGSVADGDRTTSAMALLAHANDRDDVVFSEIGRASCRERV